MDCDGIAPAWLRHQSGHPLSLAQKDGTAWLVTAKRRRARPKITPVLHNNPVGKTHIGADSTPDTGTVWRSHRGQITAPYFCAYLRASKEKYFRFPTIRGIQSIRNNAYCNDALRPSVIAWQGLFAFEVIPLLSTYVSNQMATVENDFENGEADGNTALRDLIARLAQKWRTLE